MANEERADTITVLGKIQRALRTVPEHDQAVILGCLLQLMPEHQRLMVLRGVTDLTLDHAAAERARGGK